MSGKKFSDHPEHPISAMPCCFKTVHSECRDANLDEEKPFVRGYQTLHLYLSPSDSNLTYDIFHSGDEWYNLLRLLETRSA